MSNTTPLAGMAAFAVVFLGVFAYGNSVPIALLLALLAAVGVALIVYALVPSSPELDQYRVDARRRVRHVLRTVEEIKRRSRDIQDQPARKALQSACEIIPQLLERTQENEPGSVASTAARMGVYLTSVQGAVTQYLQIQADPNLFFDAEENLRAGQQRFADFHAFALTSARQLNQGDITAYKVNLSSLAPMELPDVL